MTIDIAQAFDNTDLGYMKSTLKQRNPGPESAGSVFHTEVTKDYLKHALWEPSTDPAIKKPATGYITKQFGGLLGIAELRRLPKELAVVLQPAHGGQSKIIEGEHKGKCPAECVAVLSDEYRTSVKFTTLILGPDRVDPTKTVVWTLFPGPATFKFKEIPFENLQKRYGKTKTDRILITVDEAIALGYSYVKHVKEL